MLIVQGLPICRKSKRYIGQYPSETVPFGMEYEEPYLYYFNGQHYLIKINTTSNVSDSINLSEDSWDFLGMTVWNDVVYSRYKQGGMDIFNINDPSKNRIFYSRGEIPFYYNNITSRPFNDSLNMIGSYAEKGKQTLIGVTGKGDIVWYYKLDLKSFYNPISILNYNSLFVVKYDSSVIVLNKNGEQVFEKKFNNYVYDILKHNDDKVVIMLSNVPYFGGTDVPPPNQRANITLASLDVSTYQLRNILDTPYLSNGHYMQLHDHFFWFSEPDKGLDINLISGKIERFTYAENMFSVVEILRDIKTSQYYLMNKEKIYW